MNYNTIEELSEHYRNIVLKLISSGVIVYTDKFEFPLTEDMLNIFLIMARLGII